ncbi:unnamed protein product [Hydatigera taeniaeformis]|uniref:Uncharacterized protein n=1 Tax=Hydatigena taeniaeformis TaxID=6205 RepID=A0A3P7FQH2_HYDTA|nr:unnamed protein product [Hydatigera taeniaeformis]
MVRIKADPAAMPHHVEVLRPIQKPQQSLMSRSQPPQQLISSWGSQGSHLPPISSSDEGSPPSMIGVSSIISSTSDDVSTVSSPEPYQFIHANRKRNVDTHLFQQICSSDANMGTFYVPGDRSANDDTIRLPLQSFTPASDGFKGPSPTYNSADVAFTDVNSTTINGFNGYQAQVSPGNSSGSNFTRLSLFWGSFSLLMFNPFVISSSGAQNREGAHSAGMPILRLFSAISLSFRHSEGSDDTMSALSPLFLSFMYAAQWIVAILLLLFACPRNFGSVLPSFLTRGWGKRIRGVISELPGGRVSLLHWKRCQEHTKKRAWIEAGSRLKESLTVLGAFPSIGNGLVSTFCAHISAYFEGLRFAAYRLPQFFWHLSSKHPILRAPELLQVDVPTVSQLRRQLLDLKFLGKHFK